MCVLIFAMGTLCTPVLAQRQAEDGEPSYISDGDIADVLRRVVEVTDLIRSKGWDPESVAGPLLEKLPPGSPPKARAVAHFTCGAIYFRTEYHAAAKDCFEEAVGEFAAFPMALVLLGELHELGDEYEEAARRYCEALEVMPAYERALMRLEGLELDRQSAESILRIAARLRNAYDSEDAPRGFVCRGLVRVTSYLSRPDHPPESGPTADPRYLGALRELHRMQGEREADNVACLLQAYEFLGDEKKRDDVLENFLNGGSGSARLRELVRSVSWEYSFRDQLARGARILRIVLLREIEQIGDDNPIVWMVAGAGHRRALVLGGMMLDFCSSRAGETEALLQDRLDAARLGSLLFRFNREEPAEQRDKSRTASLMRFLKAMIRWLGADDPRLTESGLEFCMKFHPSDRLLGIIVRVVHEFDAGPRFDREVVLAGIRALRSFCGAAALPSLVMLAQHEDGEIAAAAREAVYSSDFGLESHGDLSWGSAVATPEGASAIAGSAAALLALYARYPRLVQPEPLNDPLIADYVRSFLMPDGLSTRVWLNAYKLLCRILDAEADEIEDDSDLSSGERLALLSRLGVTQRDPADD